MREIKKSGSVLGLDRLAVMAALNITNDFLSVDREHQNSRQSLVDSDDVLKHSEQRVDALIQTLKASNL
jgi:cell division protein ZapA